MTRLLLVPALAFSLAACQPETGTDDPVAQEIVPAGEAPIALDVREPFTPAAPAGGTGGVFMTLAAGLQADTLVAARSAAAERVEIHETYDAGDGMRGMREVAGGIAIGAGESVALAPGGYHVMLMNLAAGTAVGDTLSLELDFASGQTVPVRVPVVSLDAMPAPSAE